jgi:hypothetical protein
VTRPNGPVCGEENATSDVVSVLRAQRAWCRRAGRDADGVDEVGGTVGARGRGGPDGAGEDDRRVGVVQDVAEHRGLLEHVGAVGHDHPDAAARGVAGGAADPQLVLEREVRAGLVEDADGLQVGERREARHAGDQRLGVQLRLGAPLADHRDGPSGREDPDPAHGSGAAIGGGQHGTVEGTAAAPRSDVRQHGAPDRLAIVAALPGLGWSACR